MTETLEMTAGLEIHVRLKTKTKLFCNCSNDTFEAEPNSLVCPVCMAFPGTLPRLNEKAIRLGVLAGLALNCQIPEHSKFDRKSYFYPDLPAGFQISQYDEPLAKDGYLDFFVKETKKRIRINRLHLENDAGKLMHSGQNSLVDLNRAGSPLAEVVTEPDFTSPEEVFEFLKEFQKIFRTIGASDADMEKGMMRCDVNVSLKIKGAKEMGTKVEIKNMNSFANAKKALEYEYERQSKLIVAGRGSEIIQETRGFDATKGITNSQRSKEESADYRYFPEPDLPPLKITKNYLAEIQKDLPKLPTVKLEKYLLDYQLKFSVAEILASDHDLANYFETATQVSNDPTRTANWLVGDFLALAKEQELKVNEIKLEAENLGRLIKLISAGTISGKTAKELFAEIFKSNADPEKLVKNRNLGQIADTGKIEAIVKEVISENPQIAADFQGGKEKALGALVGQVMKKSQGQASPKLANQILREQLS